MGEDGRSGLRVSQRAPKTNLAYDSVLGWTVPDLPQFGSNSTGQGTTSVTLSPAPSLDGAAGSPPGSGQEGGQASSSGPSSAGGNSDDSEYDSGESPDTASTSPPPASRPQTITKAETKSFSPAPKHQQGQQGQQSQGQSGEGGEYNNSKELDAVLDSNSN